MRRDPLQPPPTCWSNAGFLARVTSLDDPERRNRVQVRLFAFDAVENQDAAMWARVAAPFAGADRGCFCLPDVDDEVLVVFVQGDPRYPVIVGGLWNGAAVPPADIESGGVNRYKRIKSKNGITITLDDNQGEETLTLETPGGQKLTLRDGPSSVVIEDSNQNSVTLEAAGITIQAAAKVTVNAAQVAVSAGMVTVDAALADFSGVVQCAALRTNAVISNSYTPGAGNVW